MSEETKQGRFLERIPGVRGWINRRRNRKARKRLLDSYTFFSTAARRKSIAGVQFDAAGCSYTLADGRRYRFDPSRAAGWLYSVPFTGVFEEKETEYLKLALQPGWTCFDVGACFGWYSVIFSQAVGETGKVYAFEPVAPNFACLKENIVLNNLDNVKLENRGLGDQPGELELFLPPEGVSASLRPHAAKAQCEVMRAEVITLDQYVGEHGVDRVDFVKADIEGAELLFLKGASSTIDRFKPMLLLEIQAHSTRLFGHEPAEVFSFLEERGYHTYRIGDDRTLERANEDKSTPLQDYNFLFKHPGKSV